MNWKAMQLIFPLMAVVIWPAGFIAFGGMGTGQADQREVAMPLVRMPTGFTEAEPGRVPMLKLREEPDSPYLKMAVAGTYDGQTWQLQDATDLNVFDRLDLSEGSSIAARQTLYPSASGMDEAILRDAGIADDPADLVLPENISQRIKNLAGKITEGLISPFEKSVAIEIFLETRYGYNLNFELAPADYEPNDWFLFQSQEGVCSHFNSAFVILARAAGIPARLVVGYYVESGVSSQTVYSDQAHAWAEVNLQGAGWTLFDATPVVYMGSL